MIEHQNANIIGIDPGVDGAICVIPPTAMHVRTYPFKNQTLRDIVKVIQKEVSADPAIMFIERVGARPGQGASAMFTFGKVVGHLEAIAACYGVPMYEVEPKEWQKGLGLGGTGLSYTERKKYFKRKAEAWFPHLSINLSNADAILIAHYAYQKRYYGKVAPPPSG